MPFPIVSDPSMIPGPHPRSDPMDVVTIMLIFLILVLLSVYLISLMLVLIRRARKLIHSPTRKYYAVICGYILSKMIIVVVLLIQIGMGVANQWTELGGDYIEQMFKNAIILADLAVCQMFLIAIEGYLRLSLSALSANEIQGRAKILGSVLILLQIAILPAFFVPLLLFNINILHFSLIIMMLIILNSLSLLLFISVFLYLNFKMTGVLLDSYLEEAIKRIYKVGLIIGASRIVMVAVEIVTSIEIGEDGFQGFISQIVAKIDQKYIAFAVIFVLTVLITLLSQGLPIMYSLRTVVINSLNYRPSSSVHQYRGSRAERMNDQSLLTSPLCDSFAPTIRSDEIQEDGLIKYIRKEDGMKQFNSLTEMVVKGEQRIWDMKIGECWREHEIQQKMERPRSRRASSSQKSTDKYVIRIAKHEISAYIMEEVEAEIVYWKQVNARCLSPIDSFTENSLLHLVEPYYAKSLDNFVDNHQSQEDIHKICLKLAKSIALIHEKGISHGSLKPSHIFVDGDHIIFNGGGFGGLRKYLSLITGYSNKNMYTAPEHMKDRSLVILKPKPESDIYSLGLLLFEIVTSNRQYRSLTLKEIQSKLIDENIRPKLPESIHPILKGVIRRCWVKEAHQRIKISTVVEQLTKIVKEDEE